MTFRGLIKDGVFLEQVRKWSSESCKVGDKGALVSEDSKDFSDFFYVSKGVGPIAQSCKFTRINGHAMTVQAHAKEVNFVFFKKAFGGLEEQVVFLKDLEELYDDLAM